MIAKTNAMDVLSKNFERTEMLITAMEKIKAYNRIYQMNQTNLEMYKAIKSAQDNELTKIEQSCAEHAIISLVTAFETYYRELVQQLLADYPQYFTSKNNKYSDKIRKLLQIKGLLTYDDIERKLSLKNRFDYYTFLDIFSIAFLSEDEKQFIEYLYLRRNNYVHNAGKPDMKLKAKLAKVPAPTEETVIGTEAKRLKTRFGKILRKSYDRILSNIVSTL